jgi:magnesium transporter
LRECLVSLARMLTFCLSHASTWMRGDTAAQIRSVARDVKSLDDYTNQQATEMTFLLQSTLGLINTSQNQIIKIFTVAGVIFMPPTLIASLYGMNLGLPAAKLTWTFLALVVVMALSAVLPIWYFKRRRLL